METIIILSLVLTGLFIVSFVYFQKAIQRQNKRLSTAKHILYPVKNEALETHRKALRVYYESVVDRNRCNTILDVQYFKKKGILTKHQSKIKTKDLATKLTLI